MTRRPVAATGRAVAARALARARLPLFANAFVLLGNSGVTAALGFLFWTLAARLYPPAEVGLASAAISSALFVATLAQLGLPYALIRFAPSAGLRRPVLTSTVVVVVTLASALGAVIFVAGADIWAFALREMAPPLVLAAAIVALGAATGASIVLVYVAVGARDARPALAAGITQGVVKSVLIVLFAATFARLGLAVLLAWLIATIAAVLLQLGLVRALLAARVDFHLLRLGSFLRYSAGNYAGDLAWAAPGLLFPLLVVGTLGAEENAYFYVAWAVASLLVAIPSAVATSFLAEGSGAHGATGPHLRRAFGLALVLVVPAIVVCWAGAPVLLGLFGAPYAANGVETLRLLAIAALPLSLNILHLTAARVDRMMRRIIGIASATGGGALVIGAALVQQYGAVGIALGYLVAHLMVATILTAEWWLRSRTGAIGRRAGPATHGMRSTDHDLKAGSPGDGV
jgi:O-antigen/teichoic acid export membrane protein